MRSRVNAVHSTLFSIAAAMSACTGADAPSATSVDVTNPPVAATKISTQAAVVGNNISFDATLAGAAFSGQSLTYSITFPSGANGLSASNGRITGTPATPAVVPVQITATNARGETASQQFSVVAFAPGLTSPNLPAASFKYSDASSPLVPWYNGVSDNTPVTNQTTDAGATLGRVLFYDTRLSANDGTSCASCHIQKFGFADTTRLSTGFNGGHTDRHAMALGNARFYQRGRFFWDERAATLEDQVLQPIQNAVEMGMTLTNLTTKLNATPYYGPLFTAAFGTSEITSDRISRALAQFVRSLVTSGSRFDASFATAPPNFSNLTAQEQLGFQLFTGVAGCAACHGTPANISDDIHNNGLDATVTDVGAGQGRFKAPSLRNVAVRSPYMHDGRFRTLPEVVAFYNTGVQDNPNLDRRLRGPNGGVKRLNLTLAESNALVAYLGTLTDSSFLTAAKFSDPYPH